MTTQGSKGEAPKSLTSAERLRGTFRAAARDGRDTVRTHQAWSAALGIKEDGEKHFPALLDALFAVRRAIDELALEIESMPPGAPKDLYSQHLADLRLSASPGNLAGHWAQVRNLISPEALNDLNYVAAALVRAQRTEMEISASDLGKLSLELDAVFHMILSLETDPELRLSLLDLVKTARRAIEEYRIRGVKALREFLMRAYGELNANRDKLDPEIRNSAPFRKLAGIIRKVHELCTAACTYGQLSEYAVKALEDLTKAAGE